MKIAAVFALQIPNLVLSICFSKSCRKNMILVVLKLLFPKMLIPIKSTVSDNHSDKVYCVKCSF